MSSNSELFEDLNCITLKYNWYYIQIYDIPLIMPGKIIMFFSVNLLDNYGDHSYFF